MPTKRINGKNENALHFLTITVIEWIDIFTKEEYFKKIIESLQFCQENKGLLLYEYVIMTNHIHLIARATDGHELSQIVSDFKKFTTREILKLLERDSRRYILNLLQNSFQRKKENGLQIWQRENYPELIVNEQFYIEKSKYIQNNPVKRGLVTDIADWKYSSARQRKDYGSSLLNLSSPW